MLRVQSTDLSVEEMDKIKKTQAEEQAKRRASVVTAPNGDKVEFEIYFEQKFPTNGGWMFDILVTKDDKETRYVSRTALMCPPFSSTKCKALLVGKSR
jgi:hypothetical protein